MAGDARRNRVAAWALAVGLFAVGAAAGVAGDRLVLGGRARDRHGPGAPAELTERMQADLKLTDAQARAVEAILGERWTALAAVSARFEPEADAIRRAADDRIRAVLEPAQREAFERRVAERERRRAELRTRLAPGSP